MTIERTQSPAVLRELFRENSPEEYVVFLTIEHKDIGTPVRVCSDPLNFILEGNEYQGFEFRINLLTDNEDMPTAQLTVQNVDRRIGNALRDIQEPANLTIEVIALSNFNTNVEPRTSIGTPTRIYKAQYLHLIDVEASTLEITGRLVSWNYRQEPYPGIYATQARLPGLFK